MIELPSRTHPLDLRPRRVFRVPSRDRVLNPHIHNTQHPRHLLPAAHNQNTTIASCSSGLVWRAELPANLLLFYYQ